MSKRKLVGSLLDSSGAWWASVEKAVEQERNISRGRIRLQAKIRGTIVGAFLVSPLTAKWFFVGGNSGLVEVECKVLGKMFATLNSGLLDVPNQFVVIG